MEQQIVLQFPVSSMDAYDAIAALEQEIGETLGEYAEVEGHDVRGGIMQVFVWCDDAATTFAGIQQMGDPDLWADAKAGWRHADDEGFEPLWPPGDGGGGAS